MLAVRRLHRTERQIVMAVKPMPPAGRAPRTSGNQRPPMNEGKTDATFWQEQRANARALNGDVKPGDAPQPQGSPGS